MRNNSFDFMRFVAATAVLISHHRPLSGAVEPALPLLRDTLGGVAVCVFFAMSGFLIYRSLERSPRWHDFFAARLARLVPNLAFALVFSSAVMLLWFQNFDNWEAHIAYVKNNLMMFFYGVQYTIPGVLEDRPMAGPNGSLWTLPYEFWMYVALFSVFLLKPPLRVVAIVAGLLAFNALWNLATPEQTVRFTTIAFNGIFLGKLGTYFFSGALLAALWPKISSHLPLTIALAVTALTLAESNVLPTTSLIFSVAFSTLVIAFCRTPWFAAFGKYGDASYGIYIFAFPVQQLTITAIDGFFASMAAALVITIPFGYATWHLFEKRCLRHRDKLAWLLALPFRKVQSVHFGPGFSGANSLMCQDQPETLSPTRQTAPSTRGIL